MDRLIVKSDIIYSIGYDAKRGDLEIKDNEGVTVCYLAVPAPVYLEFMNSENVDSYFEKKIKDQFVFRKLK